MTSPTHWVLWDDETDTPNMCGSACEGDIPEGTPYVSFYGIVGDFTDNASYVRTGLYAPTSP